MIVFLSRLRPESTCGVTCGVTAGLGLHSLWTSQKKPDANSRMASLFPNGVFVHVAVYADDSGTHDETGKLTGAKEATISGIIGLREDWISFCGNGNGY